MCIYTGDGVFSFCSTNRNKVSRTDTRTEAKGTWDRLGHPPVMGTKGEQICI